MDAFNLLSYLFHVKVKCCDIGDIVPSILGINMEDGNCLVVFSAWRLERDNVVLLMSTDADEIGRDIFEDKLKILDGKKIINADVSSQFDLKIFFEEGYSIRTFSNISYFQTENGGDWDANWRLAISKCNILACATNDFQFKIEKYGFNKIR